MTIKSDKWIRRMAESTGMIEPFEPGQIRERDGHKIISYGTSSYGYDIRCAPEFKVFTNIHSTVVDPKNFDEKSFVDFHDDVCIIPPNSFALARTLEYFRIPRNVLTICLGQAGGRAAISLERVAINVADARIADNAGEQPVDTPVVSGGPAAYFTGLPIKAMLQALQRAGLAVEVSQSAGTFVCNHVFYGLMHALERRRALKGVRGGFIHLPYLPGQGTPHMAFTDMQRGVQIAIGAALATLQDLKLAAGAEH